MPEKAVIANITKRDAVELGTNLQPIRVKVVTFNVGDQGPFTLRYTLDEYTDQRVVEDMQKEVASLRAIGAIPPE